MNPEAPWPKLERMQVMVEDMGFVLRERLPVYPEFIDNEFIEENVLTRVLNSVDKDGYVPLGEV